MGARGHVSPPMEALLAQRRADGDEAGVRHSESVLHLGAVLGQVPVLAVVCVEGRIEDDPTLTVDNGRRLQLWRDARSRELRHRWREPLDDAFAQQVLQLSLVHISEPTRPYSNSHALFCLKKKTQSTQIQNFYKK